MRFVQNIGELVVDQLRKLNFLAAVVVTALWTAVRPRYWKRSRTVGNVLSRQILFTGVEGMGFVSFVAVLVGISIVMQVQMWLSRVGQSELIGPLLVILLIREAGPILTNFVVIGRSGTAIATEVSTMTSAGEIRVLDSLGLDPFRYIVVPRILGVGLSVFCLAVLFVVVSLASGYMIGVAIGANTGKPAQFIQSILLSIEPADLVNFLAKTLIPGFLTGAICCIEGLQVGRAITDIPKANTRSLVRSVGMLFFVSALVSILTYL